MPLTALAVWFKEKCCALLAAGHRHFVQRHPGDERIAPAECSHLAGVHQRPGLGPDLHPGRPAGGRHRAERRRRVW